MINALGFGRYRCFRDPHEITLHPLTLVYGRNNAGKSAFVRAPAILADSREPDAHGLNLGAPALRRTPWLDLRWRGSIDPEADDRTHFSLTVGSDRWSWWLDEQDRAPVIAQVALNDIHYVRRRPTRHDVVYVGPDERRPVFDGIVPRDLFGQEPADRLRSALASVTWLDARRVGPPRLTDPGTAARVTGDGSTAAALVAADSDLRTRISAWFASAGFGTIDVERLANDVERLTLRAPTHNVPFPDLGEGVQQVFPVVTALEHLREFGGLLIVEEPECHLHPGLQARLAELAVAVLLANPQARVLFETHSEVFLLTALRHAAQQLNGQAGVLWVDNHAGVGTVEPVPLDGQGQPTTDVLRRAFDTMGVLQRELLAARRHAR